jgi:CelD/BcsL family acetyltransferase involved in cellulose biosynthesis
VTRGISKKSGKTGPGIVLDILTSEAEILSLGPEWSELQDDPGQSNVFLTWEWVSTWLSCFKEDCSLRFVTARAGSERTLLGIAPLAIYSHGSGRLLEYKALSFAGHELSPDHMDFVTRTGHEKKVAAAFLDWILESGKNWDFLLLDGLSASSPLVPLIKSDPAVRWHHIHESPCPFLSLPGDFSAWMSGLSKKRRYKIGNSRRQLESAYPEKVCIRRVNSDAELATAFTTLVQLHRSVRDAHQTDNAFRSGKLISFHRRLCNLFLEKGWLRLYLLSVEETDIAAVYCFHYGGVVSFYSTGYHGDFSRFSPGMLLLVHAIRESIEAGAETFDFLRGDEPYKYYYSRSCRKDFQIRIPTTVSGFLAVGSYHIARERIRPLVNSLLSRPG